MNFTCEKQVVTRKGRQWNILYLRTATTVETMSLKLLLLSRWGETMSLWNWDQSDSLPIPKMICERIWNSDRMIVTGENRRTRRKNYPSASLSTTYSIWTDMNAKPCLRGESQCSSTKENSVE
jgi:hypothetical protein